MRLYLIRLKKAIGKGFSLYYKRWQVIFSLYMPSHLIICPGVHSNSLTESFLKEMNLQKREKLLIFPSEKYPPYSPLAVFAFLQQSLESPTPDQPLLIIAFSAGVVGAMGAATLWQGVGGRIVALIALDGWGVPVVSGFPVYRLSHDYFTHWSSGLLGKGAESFYAEPPVLHLKLWQHPNKVTGWQEKAQGCRTYCTVYDFLTDLLKKYLDI